MKQWYEFQVGFYVEAESQDEAFKKAVHVVDVANDVDPEGDAQIELIAIHSEGQANKDDT